MYKETVYVEFNGKIHGVEVCCTPKTPLETLKVIAIKKLEEIERKYQENEFDMILKRMNDGFAI